MAALFGDFPPCYDAGSHGWAVAAITLPGSYMGRTGFVYHPDFLKHDMGPAHPESPERLRAIVSRIQKTGTLSRLTQIHPLIASDDWVGQIHARKYVEDLKRRAPTAGYVSLDPDTSVSPGSIPAAYLAAGGGMAGVDAILSGSVDHVFCAVRPPGHHAEHDRAMGFCLFNNVAIAARYVQQRYQLTRVLIVDWDVHHGNGTQHSFYRDGSVLFFSTHQYPYYPGTGHAAEIGEGAGKGLTMNVPMAAGQGDDAYRAVFETMLRPAAEVFKPEFIIISAGFDAHCDDPLAGMNLTEDGYADLTRIVIDLAKQHSRGRVLSCLEGGYNLTALAASVERHLLAFLDS